MAAETRFENRVTRKMQKYIWKMKQGPASVATKPTNYRDRLKKTRMPDFVGFPCTYFSRKFFCRKQQNPFFILGEQHSEK